MYIAAAKLSLVLGDSHSLKDKRMVLRKIKDRVRERLGVSLHEVDYHDSWQRSELGCAVVNGDRSKALEVIDDVVRVAVAVGGSEIVALAREVTTFDGASVPLTSIDDRTGAADKALAQDDADWIPPAWREEAK